MKKCSSLHKVAGTRNWILQVAHGLQAARSCTRAKHAEKLKCHASWSTIGKKVQTVHSVSSRLELTASNSSTLTISIITSLRGSLPKSFLTIPTSVRRPFGAWEAVRKGPISYWLILWFIAESGKLKKK